MLDLAEAGALVTGGAAAAPAADLAEIVVRRAFLWDGAVRKPGERLAVDVRQARELVALAKAEMAPPPPAEPEGDDA